MVNGQLRLVLLVIELEAVVGVVLVVVVLVLVSIVATLSALCLSTECTATTHYLPGGLADTGKLDHK